MKYSVFSRIVRIVTCEDFRGDCQCIVTVAGKIRRHFLAAPCRLPNRWRRLHPWRKFGKSGLAARRVPTLFIPRGRVSRQGRALLIFPMFSNDRCDRS
jgi:hypothetical protein